MDSKRNGLRNQENMNRKERRGLRKGRKELKCKELRPMDETQLLSALIINFVGMSSIVINTKDREEFQFIMGLLQKLGLNAQALSDEDAEDIGLSLLLKSVDLNDTVSAEEVKQKLSK